MLLNGTNIPCRCNHFLTTDHRIWEKNICHKWIYLNPIADKMYTFIVCSMSSKRFAQPTLPDLSPWKYQAK